MRTIIAGSRDITQIRHLWHAIASAPFAITSVVAGGARGVDRLAEEWAREARLPLTVVKADWERFGRSAGYRRNEQMAEGADALIAIWDGRSRGTKHMIDIARSRGLAVHVHIVENRQEQTMVRIDSFTGEYRWLSNFWPAEVQYAGLTFPSVENAYQAAKCADPRDRERFLGITAAQAKKLGRNVRIRADWADVKLPIMRDLVRQKFQHAELRDKLLATKDAVLVEGNYWGDTYWGVCRGSGMNHLGNILMDVRAKLAR